jgi:hypothetical protein
VTLREIPSALALGLLASLGAHAALYGGDHAMGGAAHGLLVELALTGVLGLGIAVAGFLWAGSRHAGDGSILGARLASRLPGWISTSLATGLWFGLGETLEPSHAGQPPMLAALTLLAAAWLLQAVARRAVRLLAEAIVAVSRNRFAVREPSWSRIASRAPIARRFLLRRRRFARPPPVAYARA